MQHQSTVSVRGILAPFVFVCAMCSFILSGVSQGLQCLYCNHYQHNSAILFVHCSICSVLCSSHCYTIIIRSYTIEMRAGSISGLIKQNRDFASEAVFTSHLCVILMTCNVTGGCNRSLTKQCKL